MQLLSLPPGTFLIPLLFYFPKHKRPRLNSWGPWERVFRAPCSRQPTCSPALRTDSKAQKRVRGIPLHPCSGFLKTLPTDHRHAHSWERSDQCCCKPPCESEVLAPINITNTPLCCPLFLSLPISIFSPHCCLVLSIQPKWEICNQKANLFMIVSLFLCRKIVASFKWLELSPAQLLLHNRSTRGVAILSHTFDCCHSLFPKAHMDPIVSIFVSFISAGPHSKGEKGWIILFLSFNFSRRLGNVLREIQTEEEKRVSLKDDQPQCLYLASEGRKRFFSGRWSIWKDRREISFVCDSLIHSP